MKKILGLMVATMLIGAAATAHACPTTYKVCDSNGKNCKTVTVDAPCPTAGGTTKRM